MATQFWVTGPAIVYSYTGSNSAQELLGYAQGGCDIEITKSYKEIMTDVLGPMVAQEYQDMGEMAVITCPLISIDRAVMNKVMNRGDRSGNGLLNTPGRLVGTNGDDFAIGIAAAADTPWYFPHCMLRPSARIPMSVESKPVTFTFLAWPFAAATVTQGVNTNLYARTFP